MDNLPSKLEQIRMKFSMSQKKANLDPAFVKVFDFTSTAEVSSETFQDQAFPRSLQPQKDAR